jgi:hypothetical protein
MLLKRILRVRPQFREKGTWFILNDNAPDPSAVTVKHFLINHRDGYQPHTLVSGPRPSQLLSSYTVKIAVKRFQDVKVLKNVTPTLISIPIKAFDDGFVQLFDRCITVRCSDRGLLRRKMKHPSGYSVFIPVSRTYNKIASGWFILAGYFQKN